MSSKARLKLVSVGMSCQAAHQLARFAEQNPQAVQQVKCPFDWLICPPLNAAKWLDEELRDFDVEHIVEREQRAYWPALGVWFWHGFLHRIDDTFHLDISGNAKKELAKLEYQRQVFASLDPQSTLFILSNTQNNLSTEVFTGEDTAQLLFDSENIQVLQSSLDRFFDSETNMKVVSRPDRIAAELLDLDNVHLLPADDSNWKGSSASWDHLLQELVL